MPDLPKYYSGLINIEAQSNSTITLHNINHHTAGGDIKTYDFSHLIPAHNEDDDQGQPLYLKTLELDYVPIKDSFMLILDGMVLSPASAVPADQQNSQTPIGDYKFIDDRTLEFLFQDGLKAHSATDTPVLLARYARR